LVKIAISTIEPGGLDALVDHRFGRCSVFTIVDAEDGHINNVEILKNPALNQSSGAGIYAAQTIANKDCKVVVTGRLGPNAYDSLNRLGIRMYMAPIGMTVKSIVESYFKGELIPYTGSTAPAKSGASHRGYHRYK